LQQSLIVFEFDSGDCGLEFNEDGENCTVAATGEEFDLSGPAIEEYLVSHGYAKRVWTTHAGGAWFTREAAEAEATSRSNFYGEKYKGWRVYCVPAHGDLKTLLDGVSDYD
jgi:hypothetical protein